MAKRKTPQYPDGLTKPAMTPAQKKLAADGLAVRPVTQPPTQPEQGRAVPSGLSEVVGLSPDEVERIRRDVMPQHPGMLILCRVGDAYHLLPEDHLKVVDLDIPAFIPMTALEKTLGLMLKAGHRVAVCEQLKDTTQQNTQKPPPATALVRPDREVTDLARRGRVVGTIAAQPGRGISTSLSVIPNDGLSLDEQLRFAETDVAMGRMDATAVLELAKSIRKQWARDAKVYAEEDSNDLTECRHELACMEWERDVLAAAILRLVDKQAPNLRNARASIVSHVADLVRAIPPDVEVVSHPQDESHPLQRALADLDGVEEAWDDAAIRTRRRDKECQTLDVDAIAEAINYATERPEED